MYACVMRLWWGRCCICTYIYIKNVIYGFVIADRHALFNILIVARKAMKNRQIKGMNTPPSDIHIYRQIHAHAYARVNILYLKFTCVYTTSISAHINRIPRKQFTWKTVRNTKKKRNQNDNGWIFYDENCHG